MTWSPSDETVALFSVPKEEIVARVEVRKLEIQ
jgi:hypothetical protein